MQRQDDEDTAHLWVRWRALGMGALGWDPESFWRATPADLALALQGWAEARGLKALALPPAALRALKARLNASHGEG